MGGNKTPEIKNDEEMYDLSEDEMDKMFGTSHADLQMRVAGIKSREEAISLKSEIENDEDLTELGKDDLKNDIEALWHV